ncbi:MAG: hypothetical protein V3T96_00640 [Thermodesulfobacteriota bacterium]
MAVETIKVDAYSGFKANERPRCFTLGNRTLKVKEIVARWYSEDHEYFRLRADDSKLYTIRYYRDTDDWEMVSEGS